MVSFIIPIIPARSLELAGISCACEDSNMQQKLVAKRSDGSRERYFKVLKYQALTTLVLSTILAMFDWVNGYSFLLGGLVYLIPTTLQARRHFSAKSDVTAYAALAQMYAGQIWKTALTVVLFALVFVLIEELSVFSIFASLILMQILHFALQFNDKR